MFYLFYRIYGHFVFRSPQPPPWGRTTGAVRPEDYPRREGCVRDKWEAQKPTTALASGLNRRILAWSGKRTLCRRSVKKRGRFACKPAKAPVLAMPNNVPAKATCGWFWVPFATKRYKASAAYAAVKAALPTKKRQRTPVADCDQYFLRPNSIWKSPRQGAVPGPPFPQNQSLFSALEPDLRLLVWWSREKSLPLKVICSNR